MADQYGVTPEDYAVDLKILENGRYNQGIPISYSIVLETTAEAFSSHFYYFDAI